MMDGLDQNLIDGKLVGADGGGTFETINPATEEVLGVAADGTAADLDAAIGAARRAFDGGAPEWADPAFRAHCIRQLRDALQSHSDELRELTISEVGAPRFLTSIAQLDSPVEDLGFAADLAESYRWTTDLGEASPVGVKSHRYVVREPAGVVGIRTDQASGLRGEHELLARLRAQERAQPALGQPQPVVGCGIEIPDAGVPRGVQDRPRFVAGQRAVQVAEVGRTVAEPRQRRRVHRCSPRHSYRSRLSGFISMPAPGAVGA